MYSVSIRNRRALAGTVRAEKSEDLASADAEMDMIDRDAVAVMGVRPYNWFRAHQFDTRTNERRIEGD